MAVNFDSKFNLASCAGNLLKIHTIDCELSFALSGDFDSHRLFVYLGLLKITCKSSVWKPARKTW